MTRIFVGEWTPLSPLLRPVERLVYHGFPLIAIEQNNLSRAPGHRVSLQLVDNVGSAISRTHCGEKPQSRWDGSRRFAGNSARESALGGMRRSLPRDTTDDERSSMGF